MIIDLHKKYDVSPEWFESQLKNALVLADSSVVEKLTLPRLCELLTVYRVNDEIGAKDAAERMKKLINSLLIDEAIE